MTPSYVHELVARQATERPEALALVCGAESLTYGELEQRAARSARRMRALGVGPEVRVAILTDRCAVTVVGLLGILKAGGTYVPFDPRLPWPQLSFRFADAEVALLLIAGEPSISLPPQWPILRLDGEEQALAELPSVLGPDQAAYVIYTSGSTGMPKGTVISHGAAARHLVAVQDVYGVRPEDRWLHTTSFSFDTAFEDLFCALIAGATVILESVLLTPAEVLRRVRQDDVTVLDLTPAVWVQCIQEAERSLEQGESNPLGNLRLVLVGGDVMPPAWIPRWHRLRRNAVRLVNVYGPTEAVVTATCHEVDDRRPPALRVPVGHPLGGRTAWILNPLGQPVSGGEVGELCLGGELLARGYLNRPDLTAAAFVPDPFGAGPGARLYRTGDLACFLEGGGLDLQGRRDHQVKLRGFRIEPEEVEAALKTHPMIVDAAVAVREVAPGDLRLVAYLVAADGPRLSAGELREMLLARQPDYMVPSLFVLLHELPRTLNGKLDRRSLPDLSVEHLTAEAEETAPRSPTEERLAGLWAEILGTGQVSVMADFFSLGGHSLLATQLVSRIGEIFSVALDVRHVVEAPTVEQLAVRVEEAMQAGRRLALPPLNPVPRQGSLELSIAQQHLWSLPPVRAGSAAYNLVLAVQLLGPLRAGLFAAAFQEVGRRHEALRTCFASAEGGPRQVVEPAAELAMPCIDLSGLREEVRETELQHWIRTWAGRPFDFGRAPLARALLFRLTLREHGLALVAHHLVSDDWSMGILLRDLSRFYFHRIDSCPPPEALPIQYADYAHWQRHVVDGGLLEAQVAYWRTALARLEPLFETMPMRQCRGASLKLRLPAEVTAALGELARRCRTSLSTLLLAAFQLLLGRFAGKDDVAVGMIVAGRRALLEIELLIGLFANLLVLRVDLSGDPRFAQILERVRETALRAHVHQEVPYGKLLEELRAPISLTQAVFAFEVARPQPLAALAIVPLRVELETARFELKLAMVEEGVTLSGALEYDADVFDVSAIHRMIGGYQALLQGIATDPERQLSNLLFLGDAERRQVLTTAGQANEDPYEGTTMEISVFGLGKVGLTLASCLAARGHDVMGVDPDSALLDRLRRGTFDSEESGLMDRLAQAGGRLQATADFAEAVARSSISFVVVPTPSNTLGGFSLRYVLEVCHQIGVALRGKPEEHTVAIVSTLLPGSSDHTVIPRLEAVSGRRIGQGLGYCYSPSFIALGEVVQGLEQPDYLLIGEADEPSGDAVLAVYRSLVRNGAPEARMTPIEAEITKIASNTHETLRVSFANMLLEACSEVPGADVDRVTEALAHRIGRRFLRGAVPYGGPCWPRDNIAFAAFLEGVRTSSRLPSAVHLFNEEHGRYVLRKVLAHSEPGQTVGLLGLSYKPGTPVVDNSFALELARCLVRERRRVTGWDPLAAPEAFGTLRESMTFSRTPEECLRASSTAVIVNPLPGLRIDWSAGRGCVVVDCWRCVPIGGIGQIGTYIPLGRGPEGTVGDWLRSTMGKGFDLLIE